MQNFNPYNSGANNYVNQNNFRQKPIFDIITGGFETARMYPMQPNQTVYLKDENSNLLFERKTDANGYFSFKTFELVEVKQPDSTEFVKKSDLIELQNQLQNQINGIVNLLQGSKKEGNA